MSHRPDGSLIDTIQVDATGRATPVVEDDSLVTVIYPYDGTSTRLYTPGTAVTEARAPSIASTR